MWLHTWLTGVKKGFCSSLAIPLTMRHSPDVRRAATAALMAVLVLLPIASTAYLKYTGASSPDKHSTIEIPSIQEYDGYEKWHTSHHFDNMPSILSLRWFPQSIAL